jgi:multidrug efflux pump subunit AcrA (membrane-fusion protein)
MAGAIVLLALAAIIGAVAYGGGGQPTTSSHPRVGTATVERGPLSDMVSVDGILSYRAQPNGSPYAVINEAQGTYTELPQDGDNVGCGGVLYRVDNQPVLLLCGTTPAYRSLSQGDVGPDVAELNANLVRLGYATAAQLVATSHTFSSATASALRKLQSKRGIDPAGSLRLSQAVVLPEPVRIATVTGQLAGPAQPGSKVLEATSNTLQVQLALDPSEQGAVQRGDTAQITLPDNDTMPGKVDRLGRVAAVPAGQSNNGGAALPAFVSLDRPVTGLDQAPVHVNITTKGVEDALSVPVTAIVGKSGGGFGVEVVRSDEQHEFVAVKLGLFDTAGGRVQVDGDLHPGDHVVVPSS